MKVSLSNDGKTLLIEAPVMDPPSPSKTGKTLIVAGTHGTMRTDIQIQGRPVVINVSAYIPKQG